MLPQVVKAFKQHQMLTAPLASSFNRNHLIGHPFLAFFSTVRSFITQPHSSAFGPKPSLESARAGPRSFLGSQRTRCQVLPTFPGRAFLINELLYTLTERSYIVAQKGSPMNSTIIYPIQLLSNKSYTTYGTYTDCPICSQSHTSFQGRQADSAADTVTKQ